MPFEFLFEPDERTNLNQLYQGDLLFKDEALASTIREAHRYYADAQDYSHFLVLTQSCDLVRRGRGKPKSRYISIAAVRPVSVLTERIARQNKLKFRDFPISLCKGERRKVVAQNLERLLHNTEDGFFFIPRESHPSITQNLCAFLPLSIAIKSEHYDTCLAGKIAQLTEIFRAKVGWLSGNQYSRVATPDFEEKLPDPDEIREMLFQELMFQSTVWLSAPQFRRLKERVQDWKDTHPDSELDQSTASKLIRDLPDQAEFVAERVTELLRKKGLVDDDDEKISRIQNILSNDESLKRLIR